MAQRYHPLPPGQRVCVELHNGSPVHGAAREAWYAGCVQGLHEGVGAMIAPDTCAHMMTAPFVGEEGAFHMSNRDSLYGDSSHTDPWEATQERPQSGASERAENAKDDVLHKAADTMSQAEQKGHEAREKAGQVAGQAQHRADEGMHKAAQTMDQAAEKLRQRGSEQGGTMGQVAGTAADTLDSASEYLQGTDTAEMMDQVEAYIRQNPVQSLLIAAGVGFVLSKAFK
jgi:ElaB/YqjD/DUF883 family membrane-anchored ribosome-binding protein